MDVCNVCAIHFVCVDVYIYVYVCIYVCLYLDFDTAIEWLNGRASVFGTEGCVFESRFD